MTTPVPTPDPKPPTPPEPAASAAGRVTSPTAASSGKSATELIVAATAVLALLISIATAYLSDAAQRDASEAEVIRTEYSIFLDLNKQQVENWQHAHLFELPDGYAESKRQVLLAIGSATQEKRIELALRERALALQIFTMYEHAIYQHAQAVASNKRRRAEFLNAVLEYFTKRLLRNPRLLHHWAPDGGHLDVYFEESTQNHYRENVLKGNLVSPDKVGPFDAPPPPARGSTPGGTSSSAAQ